MIDSQFTAIARVSRTFTRLKPVGTARAEAGDGLERARNLELDGSAQRVAHGEAEDRAALAVFAWHGGFCFHR